MKIVFLLIGTAGRPKILNGDTIRNGGAACSGTDQSVILVSALWFDKYNEIPFKVNKGLIYWYHMAWVYSINEMIEFCTERNIRMGFLNISKWSENQN